MERHLELGMDCSGSHDAFAMHDLANGNEARARLSFETAGLDNNVGRELGTGWLQAVSEVYNISADIKDYVITPVIMFPTAYPNRNGVAFSLASMGRFDMELACLGYESWKRRPTHYNHDNDHPENAKGVVFDTRMLPLAGTNQRVWKAVALYGCDRTRDPVLANSILTGEYQHYSMGASVGSYECSVCGHRPTKQQNGCDHLSLDNRTMKVFNTEDRGPVLAHYICDHIRGFELSCVYPTPAWAAAHVTPDHLLSLSN